jgi:hypothetical protein
MTAIFPPPKYYCPYKLGIKYLIGKRNSCRIRLYITTTTLSLYTTRPIVKSQSYPTFKERRESSKSLIASSSIGIIVAFPLPLISTFDGPGVLIVDGPAMLKVVDFLDTPPCFCLMKDQLSWMGQISWID